MGGGEGIKKAPVSVGALTGARADETAMPMGFSALLFYHRIGGISSGKTDEHSEMD